jgi:hypothetical protein
MWAYLVRYPGLAVLHDGQLHHARGRMLLQHWQPRMDDYRREFWFNHPDANPDLAELPTAGPHGSVGGRVSVLGERWRVDVASRGSIPRRETRTSAVGSFDAWAIEARGCFVPIAGPIELPLCPGLELGSVRGRGLAPTPNPTTSRFLWVAPSLSQGLAWAPVPRLALGIELGLVVPLTRGRFAVGGAEIEQLSVFGVRGLASVELRI